ncbi:hypothetical protein [Chitinophaga barathri]|uniref:Uncharacterized protein n=1 Tax=Chitinophaga barathri TaxID=1647451 RepID=A0A3N4MD01_9BACT|nr:hypothetical protein [Chitinophaga barathri]RPD41754.1 hypothetical protein EG028_06185 [Chitinophaga barathri]
MKRFPLILFVYLALCTSCEKNIPEGLTVSVGGTLVDENTGRPIPYIWMQVNGNNYPAHPPLDNSIVAVQTDKDGYFSASFKTDGRYRQYTLSKGTIENRVYKAERLALDPRKYNNILIKAKNWNILQVNLKVLQNPYDTLSYEAQMFNTNNYEYLLKGRQLDTVVYFRYAAGHPLELRARVIDRVAGRQRVHTQAIETPLRDTFIQNITINNTADFPIFNP